MVKLIWLLPLSLVLYACPFESNVALEPAPVEKADSSLTGFWYGIIKDGSDYFGIEALEISLVSDSVYQVIRYGKSIKGDMILPDTVVYNAFTSTVGEQSFMNIYGPSSEDKKRTVYYISAWELQHDTLHVQTVTENFTTRKNFRSAAEFKQLVSTMKDRKNFYDEQYSLYYRKIPKPAAF